MRLILNTTTGEIKEIENPAEGIRIEKIESHIVAEFKFKKDRSISLALLHPKSSRTNNYDVKVLYFLSDERVEFRDSNDMCIEFTEDNDNWDCWAESKICLIMSVVSLENYLGEKFNFPRHVKRKIFGALAFNPPIIL